ncbi:MAG TPA: hypothetical protein VEZ46_15400 [Mycobacteriales bacterium]|nr:hypothetical protein [Mycobacteriales bacterium]
MAEFDPKKANNDDWGVIGGGAVVLISSFFAWYGTSGAGAFDASASGWDSGFLALLAILLCTAAAAWVAFRVFGSGNAPDMPVGPNLLALVLAGVGAVFILLRLVTFERESVGPISVGPKFGVFIALLAAIAQAFFAWRLFKASGEQMAVDKSRMPSRPATAGAGPVDGGQAGYAGPPAGYAPPPAPPAGYAPPPAPPAGYAAPQVDPGYAAPQAHPGYAAPPAAPSYDDTGQTSAGYAEGAQPGYGSAQRDPNQPPPPNA